MTDRQAKYRTTIEENSSKRKLRVGFGSELGLGLGIGLGLGLGRKVRLQGLV